MPAIADGSILAVTIGGACDEHLCQHCLDSRFASAQWRSTLDPEALFERRWALTILERTMARLRQALEQAGRGAEFEQLEGYLTGSEPRVRYHDVAERLGTTEGAVKKMVHRLRRRYGLLLREEANLSSPLRRSDL